MCQPNTDSWTNFFILNCYFTTCNWSWFGHQQLRKDSWEKCRACWRKTYCLLVWLKRSSDCRPLISDISCDMTHALKACIHHHPSFGVNLKVAAVWMSTPYTCGHFQMPPLFIRPLWSGTDKGGRRGREKTLADNFFRVVAGRPKNSNQQGRVCFI